MQQEAWGIGQTWQECREIPERDLEDYKFFEVRLGVQVECEGLGEPS